MRRVYFHQGGKELLTRAGMLFSGFGEFAGRHNGAVCFTSVTVANDRGYETTITERDLGGPFSVKLWAPEERPEWFGVADYETIARVNDRHQSPQAAK